MPVAISAATMGLRSELKTGMRRISQIDLGVRTVEVAAGRDALWAIVPAAGPRRRRAADGALLERMHGRDAAAQAGG